MAQTRAQNLRRDIERYRQKMAGTDHPETVRLFNLLITDAQAQLDQIEKRTRASLVSTVR